MYARVFRALLRFVRRTRQRGRTFVRLVRRMSHRGRAFVRLVRRTRRCTRAFFVHCCALFGARAIVGVCRTCAGCRYRLPGRASTAWACLDAHANSVPQLLKAATPLRSYPDAHAKSVPRPLGAAVPLRSYPYIHSSTQIPLIRNMSLLACPHNKPAFSLRKPAFSLHFRVVVHDSACKGHGFACKGYGSACKGYGFACKGCGFACRVYGFACILPLAEVTASLTHLRLRR